MSSILQAAKSKTMWFNFLYILVVIAGLFGFQDFAPDSAFAKIGETIALIGGPVVNMWLRSVTTTALSEK